MFISITSLLRRQIRTRSNKCNKHYKQNEKPPDEEAKARYATTISSLIYLIVSMRPDITRNRTTKSLYRDCSAISKPHNLIGSPSVSAIALSRNPEFHKRTKHFNVKFHYQRAMLNTGEIRL
ncbi:uncharacterized protein N7498_000019 [Penicillium cinerascens]|uniref:Uncharacterized protein n=1 Tax=Penicillium cinerascens TaxID=70096 RepID=A0A9W9NDK7_9EURO|nr:uncharacterized protein N7498_000019 [Penicillium cinerascens]KAJ5217920.1 hypothetical protein N7498_000019 [Penicillium cinerascens]